jgi:hypothetical protein
MSSRSAHDDRIETMTMLSRAESSARFLYRHVLRAWRFLSSAYRPLPDMLLIGAQKSGSTSLFRYLSALPSVTPAIHTETHFFDLNYERGEKWYRSQFPFPPRGTKGLVIEGSPYYIFHPRVAALAVEMLPAAKIVAMLRDPVDRALSHYQQTVHFGFEPLALEDALAAEEDRLRGEVERLRTESTYQSYAHRHFTYKSRGIYAEQIEGWIEHFGRDQLLVLESEALFGGDRKAFERLHDFLGLAMPGEIDFPVQNTGSRPEASDEVVRSLTEYFAPHNERLYSLLGERFSWDTP